MKLDTIDTYAAAAQLLARRVGLRLDSSARRRLARCVDEEAGERGIDVDAYVRALEGDGAMVQSLLNRITVQETSFFRDPVQFDVLARHVLPTLTPPFTIWSAGCANGQEPYSLAMVLEEAAIPGAGVLTTDISTRALARAREGVYSTREIGGLSSARRQRFLVPECERFSIATSVRERVEIAQHNLVGSPPAPQPGTCPIVFCRNVLIYFSAEEILAFLDRVAELLPPGGWLFLGYSESLWQVTDRFELVRLGDAFVYRRRGRAVGDPQPEPRKRTRVRSVALAPARTPARTLVPQRTHVDRAPAGPSPSPATTVPPVQQLISAAEAATAAGEHATAVANYRKCVYLDPEQPVLHVHLALALEAAGDRGAARRSFAVARSTLDACDGAGVEAAMDGYPVGELARLVDRKLEELA